MLVCGIANSGSVFSCREYAISFYEPTVNNREGLPLSPPRSLQGKQLLQLTDSCSYHTQRFENRIFNSKIFRISNKAMP